MLTTHHSFSRLLLWICLIFMKITIFFKCWSSLFNFIGHFTFLFGVDSDWCGSRQELPWLATHHIHDRHHKLGFVWLNSPKGIGDYILHGHLWQELWVMLRLLWIIIWVRGLWDSNIHVLLTLELDSSAPNLNQALVIDVYLYLSGAYLRHSTNDQAKV